MATIEHGICYSFKYEMALGTHDFDSDTFKIALYDGSTDLLLADVTAYSATGECSGAGYAAGGQAIALASGFPKLNETALGDIPAESTLLIDFDDETFSSVSIQVRAGLIYNSSKSNKAVCILDFGQIHNVNGDLQITFPTPSASGAILRAR